MTKQSNDARASSHERLLAHLHCAWDAVGELIVGVHADQWSLPTPCADWTVRQLVDHLIGGNRVFKAILTDEPLPRRPSADHVEPDPAGAYRRSAAELQSVFEAPGVLDRDFMGPLGSATGAERLQIRLYDLIAHGWDLAQATKQTFDLPDDIATASLVFARSQIDDQMRPGRFAPAQHVEETAPAILRLAGFLGRPVAPRRE